MDLLDRLLAHDCWTTRQLLNKALALSDAQLDREFDIGHRTLRRTFSHVIRNMEVWSALMARQLIVSCGVSFQLSNNSVSAVSQAGSLRHLSIDADNSISGLVVRLDNAANILATVARSIQDRNAWDVRWVDQLDGREKSYGGSIAHVLTHSMHHRAQILYLLRLTGVTDLPEGDVLSWESATQ